MGITKDQVCIDVYYVARVGRRRVVVRLDAPHPRGGWLATNMTTGRDVHISSWRRLQQKIYVRIMNGPGHFVVFASTSPDGPNLCEHYEYWEFGNAYHIQRLVLAEGATQWPHPDGVDAGRRP